MILAVTVHRSAVQTVGLTDMYMQMHTDGIARQKARGRWRELPVGGVEHEAGQLPEEEPGGHADGHGHCGIAARAVYHAQSQTSWSHCCATMPRPGQMENGLMRGMPLRAISRPVARRNQTSESSVPVPRQGAGENRARDEEGA